MNGLPDREGLQVNLFRRRKADLALYTDEGAPRDREGNVYEEEYPTPEGMYSVTMHGYLGGRWVQNADGRALNGHEIADIIRADPNYHGQPIYLVVCDAGRGRIQFAQELANAMKVDVYASNVIVQLDGRFPTKGAPSYTYIALINEDNPHLPQKRFDRFRPGLDIAQIRENGKLVFGPGVGLGRRPGTPAAPPPPGQLATTDRQGPRQTRQSPARLAREQNGMSDDELHALLLHARDLHDGGAMMDADRVTLAWYLRYFQPSGEVTALRTDLEARGDIPSYEVVRHDLADFIDYLEAAPPADPDAYKAEHGLTFREHLVQNQVDTITVFSLEHQIEIGSLPYDEAPGAWLDDGPAGGETTSHRKTVIDTTGLPGVEPLPRVAANEGRNAALAALSGTPDLRWQKRVLDVPANDETTADAESTSGGALDGFVQLHRKDRP
jgi:hypothetical protein